MTVLLIACFLNICNATLAGAANPTGMCDPNNPARRAKQLFRQENDILYFDNCAGTCSGSSSASLLPGDNYAEKAYNYLVSKGWTPAQAAGMVGNMIAESGVNPQRLQGTGLNDQTPADQAVGSSAGWGIVQWTPAGKMIKPTKDVGKDPNDLGVQLEFLDNQLNTNEKSAGDQLKAHSSTPEEAAGSFEQFYERHAVDSSGSARAMYAKAIYEKAVNGTPYPPEIEAAMYKGNGVSPLDAGGKSGSSGTGSCGSTAADNGECKNPFRDLKNSAPMRWDGGLDYGGDSGEGPVYAACPAEITLVQGSNSGPHGSGWPGIPGSYIAYKITSGKAKDLYMYIAEDCTPTVSVGDKVTTDQPICQYKQASAYLETGWSEGGQNSYVKWTDYRGKANGYASNSGVDVGKFLSTLGVGQGHDSGQGISNVPPPADWPKW